MSPVNATHKQHHYTMHFTVTINADRTKDVTRCCSVTNADICHGVYSLRLGRT